MSAEHCEKGREPTPHWAVWCDLIAKYQLTETIGRVIFRGAVVSLQNGLIWTPAAMGDLPKRLAMASDQTLAAQGAAILLRQCAKCHLEYPMGAAAHRFHTDRDAMAALIQRIRCECVEEKGLFRRRWANGRELGRPATSTARPPRGRWLR